jgi:hypothetical protein
MTEQLPEPVPALPLYGSAVVTVVHPPIRDVPGGSEFLAQHAPDFVFDPGQPFPDEFIVSYIEHQAQAATGGTP